MSDWDAHNEDFEPPPRVGMSKEKRIEHGWCVACGMFRVEVYFCQECSCDSQYVGFRMIDERRAPTATSISRSQQRRVDIAAAHEQMIQLQTVLSPGTSPVDGGILSGEVIRSAKIRGMAHRASGGFIQAVLDSPNVGPVPVFNQRPNFNRRRQHAATWWQRFTEIWSVLAWQILDDLTRPE